MAETMEGAPVKQAAAVAVIRPAAAVVADSAVAAVAPEPADELEVAEVAEVAAATAGLEPTTIVFSTDLEPGHRPGFF